MKSKPTSASHFSVNNIRFPVPFKPLFHRFFKLSNRKKLVVLGLLVLLSLVVVSAYYRILTLTVILIFVMALVAARAGHQLDTTLRRLRLSSRIAPSQVKDAVMSSKALDKRPIYSPSTTWGSNPELSPQKLVQRLTVLRSLDGRDVLVRQILGGHWDWKHLESALEMMRLGGPARKATLDALEGTTKVRLLQIADLCYKQNILENDILNAATLYRYVYQKLGPVHFRGKKRGEFFLDALSQIGKGDQTLRFQSLYDVNKFNPHDINLFRANAKNPYRHEGHDIDAWLAEVNEMYSATGLSEIKLRPGSTPAFTRLYSEIESYVETGPLVSIVMPVFKPDDITDLAIRSALNQTYRNIEVIIVDDGSGEEYKERLLKWLATDDRIQVILNTPNSGAYTSRNIGYSAASGEYLTIFDGDDWQHPQKIELLVSSAVEQNNFRLISAAWSRVDKDLMFHYRGWKGAYVTPAHVSTMFPMEVIREKLGFWDSVRKAADTEFILRYQILVNEEEPLSVSQVPLTLSLVGDSNLSMDDFRLGYRSPDRVAYRSSYEHWHKKVRRGEHSGYLPFGEGDRLFCAPARFLPQRPEAVELDVLFVSDFGNVSETSEVWQNVREALASDLKVGLMHMPSILNSTSIRKSYPNHVMEEFEAGSLLRIEVTDTAQIKEAHVYDPTALEFTSELRSGLRAEVAVLHADTAPYQRGAGYQYTVGAVTRNLSKIFGGSVLWSSRDPDVVTTLDRTLSRPAHLQIKLPEMSDSKISDGLLPQTARF